MIWHRLRLFSQLLLYSSVMAKTFRFFYVFFMPFLPLTHIKGAWELIFLNRKIKTWNGIICERVCERRLKNWNSPPTNRSKKKAKYFSFDASIMENARKFSNISTWQKTNLIIRTHPTHQEFRNTVLKVRNNLNDRDRSVHLRSLYKWMCLF